MIDKGLDKGVEIMSDHPKLSNRVEAARKAADELGPDRDKWRRPPVANAAKFRQIQDRAARLASSLPSDKTLAQSQELLRALPRSCLTPAIQEDQIQAKKRLQRDLEDQDRQQETRRRR
jgi:hypothetical protein